MLGNRESALLHDHDEEENIIIEAILNGLEDAGTITTVSADLNLAIAAPEITSLIHTAIQGDTESLDITTNLIKQF